MWNAFKAKKFSSKFKHFFTCCWEIGSKIKTWTFSISLNFDCKHEVRAITNDACANAERQDYFSTRIFHQNWTAVEIKVNTKISRLIIAYRHQRLISWQANINYAFSWIFRFVLFCEKKQANRNISFVVRKKLTLYLFSPVVTRLKYVYTRLLLYFKFISIVF